METVVQSIIEPDSLAIKSHLESLFAPLRDLYPDGLVELRHGHATNLTNRAYFGLSEKAIEEATAYAASVNGRGENVYVGVNPRRGTSDRKRAASDADVEIAIYHFADLDQFESVEAARMRSGLSASAVVITGTIPNTRVHLYWLLDEPVANMQAWTERQRAIAAFLGGDAVINPSRIMRLGGTVNFPPPHKVQRGYKVERSTVKTDFADERPPVSVEQIMQAFPGSATPSFASVPAGATTLSAMRRTQVGDLLDACRTADQWHNNMIRLVAHLAGKERSDAEILGLAAAITLPGFTVDQTTHEMHSALKSARVKWDIPEPVDDVEKEEQSRTDSEGCFEILDMDELEALPPPTWLVHELVADHGLTVVYGDPGAGKSFVAIDMALRLSYGMDWHGINTLPTGVLYIAGEGARGLGKRIKGWRREHAMEGVDAPFLLLPVAVQLLEPKERAKLLRTITQAMQRCGFHVGLIVVDTVSRALAGADENGQEAMSMFVSACGEIQQFIGGAVLAVHHSGKDKERGMRGSTVLLGGCDASIKVTKSEETVTIKTEKQKDAEQAQPIYMTMKKVEWAAGFEEPQSTLVPVKREKPAMECDGMKAEQIERVFNLIETAWISGNPFSPQPQTRSLGRYAPSVIGKAINVTEKTVADYIQNWLENGQMEIAVFNSSSKKTGIRIVRRINHNV